MSVHALLIVVHAVAATVALLAGLLVFRSPRLVYLHAAGVALMTVTLIAAVVVGRGAVPTATLIVFGALCVVALVMTVQASLAWRRRPRPGTGGAASQDFLMAVGFNCIGLVTGFVAVTVTRLSPDPLPVIAAPVATVLIGRTILLRRVAG